LLVTIDPEALYIQLGRLVETMPKLTEPLPYPRSTQEWLGRVGALIAASGDIIDIAEFQTYASSLSQSTMQFSSAQQLITVVYRALAKAELKAPASIKGAFIPVGASFDALGAVAKVLGSATKEALIVDPYLDEKILTEFAVLAAEGVRLHLLADQHHVKPGLRPAAARWTAQHGALRPLEARLTPPRTLHDRVIVIDNATAWLLTQSFNGLAARSPAAIVQANPEIAALKIPAYQAMWAGAAPL
jgi:hypothetical protein